MGFRVGFLLVLAIAIVGFGFFQLHSFNYFDRVEDEFAGACAPVAGVYGAEDLQIDAGQRRAFISSLNRRAQKTGNQVRGAIFAVNIDDPLEAGAWRDRTNGAPEAFEPLGLHYYVGEGVQRLFVVNSAADSVELFDVASSGDLVHLETFTERRLTSPNDVVAVGPRAFYVSNDVEAGRGSLLGVLQFLGRTASGEVLHYNGQSWRLAAESLRFANGVNVSPDGRRFYVTETSGGALKIYDRDPANGALTIAETISLDMAPDNINIDETGTLWIGGMPKPLSLPGHENNAEKYAPSRVVQYRDAPASGPVEVYNNAGSAISAATAAARLGDTLLIGALLEDRYLLCDMAS